MSDNVATMPKRKRTRSPSVAKPVYLVVQLMDEEGNPQKFDKKRIQVKAVERIAEKAYEMTDEDDGAVPNGHVLRIIIPVARTQPHRKAAE